MLGVVEGHEPGTCDHAERVLLGVLRVRFGEVRREREARQRVEVAARLLRELLDDRRVQLHLARRGEELEARLLVLLRHVGNLQVLHLLAEVAELHAERRHLVVHHVLVLRTPPLVGEAKALGKPVPELVVIAEVDVGAAFEALEDGHAASHAHLLDVHGRVTDAAALEPRRRGQHVVGQRRRRRHEVIVHDEQIKALQRFMHELRVAEREHRVVRLHDACLDGVGVAADHLAEHRRRVAVGIEARVGLRDDVPALEGEARVHVVADHLVALLLGEGVVREVHVLGVAAVARHGQLVAADLVDVARDGAQDGLALNRARGVEAAAVAALLAPRQAGGLGRRVHASRLADLVGGNPGDFRDLLDGIFRRALFQLVKAVTPFLDELMVVEVLLDDHVDHAEGECRIGAGADLQEEIGLLGDLAETGVDDDELRAALLHVAQGPLPVQKLGRSRVAAPQNDEVSALPVRLIGAEAAVGARLEPHVGAVADGAVAAGVRRAEQVGELVVQVGLRAVCSLEEAQGFGSVLVAKIGKALGHFVKGLVPGDFLPLAASAFADSLEGSLQAVGVV